MFPGIWLQDINFVFSAFPSPHCKHILLDLTLFQDINSVLIFVPQHLHNKSATVSINLPKNDAASFYMKLD